MEKTKNINKNNFTELALLAVIVNKGNILCNLCRSSNCFL